MSPIPLDSYNITHCHKRINFFYENYCIEFSQSFLFRKLSTICGQLKSVGCYSVTLLSMLNKQIYFVIIKKHQRTVHRSGGETICRPPVRQDVE